MRKTVKAQDNYVETFINHNFRDSFEWERHPETASALLNDTDVPFNTRHMLLRSTYGEVYAKLVFKLCKLVVSMNDGDGKTALSEDHEDFLNNGDDISRASLICDTACVIFF